MAAAVAAGVVEEPDADVAAAMMREAVRALGEAGLARYEIANYARAGEESEHNLGYWTGRPYLGVGPSAASMLPVSLAKLTPLGMRLVNMWPDDWRARFVWNDGLGSFV
ncbi:MAG: hypothetical protein FDZ70_07270, partial [Actinobacteria bacterium]